jgi:Ca-activated chloride channel family protein
MNELLPILKTFRFSDGWFLPLLCLIPLWIWLRGRFAPVAAVQFSSGKLLQPASRPTRFNRNRWLLAFRYAALGLLLLALARPQVEKGAGDDDAKGINIMLVLDYSSTMNTKDFTIEGKKVSRAEALKKVIAEFMRARPQDKLGVVKFDAEAYLVSPLTLDHDWLIHQLGEEKTGRGTAPGSGMLIAAEHLLPATNQTKVIIVVTDAEQVNHGADPLEVGKTLVPFGIKVHVIQIVGFKDMSSSRDQWNPNPLPKVAEMTGGQRFQVADFNGLRSVYQQIDRLEKATFKEDKQKSYRELMAWCGVPSLLLLLLELLLRQTVWRRLP